METYTPEQAAKILQVNVQTVRRWLRTGDMTGANTTAGWRLTPTDIEGWLDRQRQPRTPRGSTVGLNKAGPGRPRKVQPSAQPDPEPQP